MSWESWEQTIETGPGATLWRMSKWVIGIIIFISLVGFFLNPFQQVGSIINKTINADNVLYNYEWFKLRHEAINAIDSKIVSSDKTTKTLTDSLGLRKEWHREDRIEHARLSSICLGLRQQRDDLVAEYNAKSRMVNRSIFKAGDAELPTQISLK